MIEMNKPSALQKTSEIDSTEVMVTWDRGFKEYCILIEFDGSDSEEEEQAWYFDDDNKKAFVYRFNTEAEECAEWLVGRRLIVPTK